MSKIAPKIPTYYAALSKYIKDNDYISPREDTDPRINQAWDLIEKTCADVRIEFNFDFFNSLCERSDPMWSSCQSRVAEDLAKIQDYADRFYCEDSEEPMRRMPIGIMKKGIFYPALGNHRSRAHELAMKKGHPSKGGVIIVGENLSPLEQRALLAQLAAISNMETGLETTPEKEEDIIHQLQHHWGLEVERDPSKGYWDSARKTEWGDSWIKEWKPIYRQPNRQHRVTGMVNRAFSDDVKQVLPFPYSKEEIPQVEKDWQCFFPHMTWDPSESTTVKQVSHAGNYTALQILAKQLWSSKPRPTPTRKKIWLHATTESSRDRTGICSIDSVKKRRMALLNFLTTENLNVNHVDAGFPIFERVLFHHQLVGEPNAAYEWNYQTEEFNEVFNK